MTTSVEAPTEAQQHAESGSEPPWRRLARLEAKILEAQAADEATRPRLRARSQPQEMQLRFAPMEGQVARSLTHLFSHAPIPLTA